MLRSSAAYNKMTIQITYRIDAFGFKVPGERLDYKKIISEDE